MKLGAINTIDRSHQVPKCARAAVVVKPAPIEATGDRKPIGIAKLNFRSCRYPFGDPQSPDFGYCGAIREGSVYCADHHRLCYVPLSRRSDVSKEQERAFA